MGSEFYLNKLLKKNYIRSYRLSLQTNAHTQCYKQLCKERGDARKMGTVCGDTVHRLLQEAP